MEQKEVYDTAGFARGADVSWITEMEYHNVKFYDAHGNERECMELLRELGMDAIRLRVWVDPADGWCNKEDLLVKASRAHNLGMRLMINFHYSDTFADPRQQTKPAAWEDMTLNELQVAIAGHTKDVLNGLKELGITPEWVQVGNETSDGMLWDTGRPSINENENMENYAKLNNAGYDAVKEVFPDAKVIVHLPNGAGLVTDYGIYDPFEWIFEGLRKHGGKWDVIGASLYPSLYPEATWQEINDRCLTYLNNAISKYGSEVMLCEVGMPWDEAETSYAFLSDLIARTKAIENNKCLGVFYWEPQSYDRSEGTPWKDYQLGAFDESGRPTIALNAFATPGK